jgi:N-acetylglucosamine-6-phosphate deacetylase
MATTVHNAVELLGVDLVQAVRMASQYPAEFLGLGGELGRIAPAYRANLALVDDALDVKQTWIDGRTST